jgi:CHAT domain-containing protein
LHAELVVLSACQTGVSIVLHGDEPMGLVRAFLYAGAHSVLVSQWPVEDLPTFLLMQHFYKDLQREADPADALQAAQVWLRELTAAQAQELLLAHAADDLTAAEWDQLTGLAPASRPFSHPRHWAAFIVVGRG